MAEEQLTETADVVGRGWPAHRLPLVVACLISAAAIGWRLVDVTEWPYPADNTVQYESALAARAIWVAASPAARTPEREAWYRAVGFYHVVSPPVLPALVVACYLISGEEIPWVSKVFTALFWAAAGWLMLAALVRQGVSRWAAVAAMTYLTFTPFGQLVARSFQTESVVVFAFAAAVLCLARPGRGLGWRETVTVGLACGLAAAVKPGTLQLPLAAGFAAWAMTATGSAGRKFAATGLFISLLLLPSAIYALVRLGDRGGMIRPHLLADAAFYRAVADMIRRTVGYPALTVGLIGAVLAARAGYPLTAGLFVGYAGYVATFTYHCSTHPYYHTPLMVPVALGVGWAAQALIHVVRRMAEVSARAVGVRDWAARARWLVAAVMLAALARYVYATRTPWAGPWRWTANNRAGLAAAHEKEANLTELVSEIAATMRPGGRAVALTSDYGYAYEYWTNTRVLLWPRTTEPGPSGRPAAARLDSAIAAGFDYFAVYDLPEYAAQPDLQAALVRRGRLVLERPDLLLFELR